MTPIVRNELSLRVFGRDNLAGVEPPVIFFSNHSSHLDATLIMCTLPDAGRRRPRSARRATTSSTCGGGRRSRRSCTARSRSTARVARRARSTRRASSSSEGWSIVVFPEGTRSADGHLQRFRHGAARLALETGAGLAPIAIVGAFQAMPKGRFWPRTGRPPVTVRYGEPFWPQEGRDASGPLSAHDPGRDPALPRGADDLVGGAASRAARRDPVPRRPVGTGLAPAMGGLAPGRSDGPRQGLGVAGCRGRGARSVVPPSWRRRSGSSAARGTRARASMTSPARWACGSRRSCTTSPARTPCSKPACRPPGSGSPR